MSVILFQNDQNYDEAEVWVVRSTKSQKGDRLMDIRPWAWSHACINVDLINGVASIMVNEMYMPDFHLNDTDFFQSKPQNLNKHLTFGDGRYQKGRVLQSENSISNVHVFKKLLIKEQMYNFTGKGACNMIGDYLSWEDMNFILFGDTKMFSAERDKCKEFAKDILLFLSFSFIINL